MKGYKAVHEPGRISFVCNKCRYTIDLRKMYGSNVGRARTLAAKDMNRHIEREHPEKFEFLKDSRY